MTFRMSMTVPLIALVALLGTRATGSVGGPALGVWMPPGSGAAQEQRPECPQSGHWTLFFSQRYRLRDRLGNQRPGGPLAIMLASGQITAAGPNTDIPEFHDCQQFIEGTAASARFTSLFAIFASDQLDKMSRSQSSVSPNSNPRQFTSQYGVLIAEIYAFDRSYLPLGIERHFNCLYYKEQANGKSQAWMVPVDTNERACADSTAGNGTLLVVSRTTMRGASPTDYPAVAKWDYDMSTRQQYIGIRCGSAWCEIHGSGTFSSSRAYQAASPSGRGAVPATPASRRVVEVKGWYDEQRLAVMKDGKLVPGPIGTLVPDPTLGDERGAPRDSRFARGWVKVATVGLSGQGTSPYATKLTLAASPVTDAINTVSLCYSPANAQTLNPCFRSESRTFRPPACRTTEPVEWWAKSESPGKATTYRCVIRRAHDGISIPGVVRWRWMLADDTMWIRCLDGCCEVEATLM